MTALRSGPLAAWASSWLTGAVGADDLIDAITGDDPLHEVIDANGEAVTLTDVLLEWRRDGTPVRLVLPVPGDVRGVPTATAFRAAAIEAGEAVCGARLAVVPELVDHYPSSAPDSIRWTCFAIDPAAPDYVGLSDAQQELTTAIRDAASALNAADVAGAGDEILDALRAARRAGQDVMVPPGFPSRAVALLSQAERIQAMLDLALADPVGGAVDRFGMSARSSALRPLETTVRRARLAGYNALAEIG